MSTCFFIGHRDVSDSVLSALEQEVERHITEYGITDFVVGHYGRFDSLAAQALSRAKVRYPGIRLTLLLPYHPAEHPFPKPESFDDTFYPPQHGTRSPAPGHHPRKSVYGEQQHASDCLCQAPV